MRLRGLAAAALVAALFASRAAPAAPPDGTTLVPPQVVLMEGKGRQVAFVAEKATQQFHVYEWSDGRARLVETLPCTTGKVAGDKRVEGDLKTPEGVYWFTRYISGEQLPPLYGSGALVMDYPNPFDVQARKTGSGIWMHGVETDDRVHVARDTRGCVALRNGDFDRMRRIARLHDTPIVVVERLEGVPPSAVTRDAADMRAFVEGWRRAWESKDMDAYLARYAPDFAADGRDLRSWERQKRELARTEGERRIGVDEVRILRERDRWWVTFRQEYATAGHRDAGVKTLFIRGQDPSSWRIASERWRALDGPFRILDAEELPRFTPELVAAIAPDAAPAPPRVAAASRPRETRAPAAPAPPVAAPEPETPPAATEPPATTPVAAVAAGPAAEPVAPVAPAAALVEPPAPPARPRALVARLEAPRTTRRTFQLLGPHVQRQGEALYVQVQLLNMRATSTVSGALIVSLPASGGAPPEPPRAEPFAVKQGRLIALSLPDAELPTTIRLAVRDDAGRLVLDQDLVIEAL